MNSKKPNGYWTFERIQKEALKYKTRKEFYKNNRGAYKAALRQNVLDEVCSHMPKYVERKGEKSSRYKWTDSMLQKEALKYKTRKEFRKNSPAACLVAGRRGILDQICSHMKYIRTYWTDEMLMEVALKYNEKTEFARKESAAYSTAYRRGILNKICAHMKTCANTSIPEIDLFGRIKSIYPKTQKFRDRKVSIPNKPHIRGFDLDIYIPELRKGIEFDGKYWHSKEGLKRSRDSWPEDDIHNYSQLKDSWFASKGIKILHIKEKDWDFNKENCIKRCLEFLKQSNK
jgi:hypothetical protein